jgi:serine/threonine-protein kinase
MLIDGRYEVDRLLGRGGMADVVRADDAATGEPVAIKLLRDPDVRNLARFRTEIETPAVLDHPSVVRLRGSGGHGKGHGPKRPDDKGPQGPKK